MAAIAVFVCALLCVAYTIYFSFNKGMSRSARGQQTRRMAVAVVVAGASMLTGLYLTPLIIGLIWMGSYPLLYHLTHRKVSPDYENYADITAGIYLIGLLHALTYLAHCWTAGLWIVSLIACAALVPMVFLWVYYVLYGTVIDANGMQILQETHINEMIEFVRSFAVWKTLLIVMGIVFLVWLTGYPNFALPALVSPRVVEGNAATYLPLAAGLYAVAIAWYLFKPHHSLMSRTGLIRLYLDIRDYREGNLRYKAGMAERLKRLEIRTLAPAYDAPHTVLLVIGESASRDYMSAFTPRVHDTTPWMRQMAADTAHTLLFKRAYSCAMHTVQALEKALTEANQYRAQTFVESCSVVDIAHAMGYRVHWYSNQGHLGAVDTPVTLVAETSDVAKWTKQDVGRVQYDETLLDFLDELNPQENNLLVLHLKGSHFNFLNRYPNDTHTVWGKAGVQEDVLNYENSLRYTDGVLQKAFAYCTERLNLKWMVYCSDHATVPARRRSPNFNGFGDVRIPLFVWMSDEFIAKHATRVAALRANEARYFTNDLLYELFCGMMDIASNRFDEKASLASTQYKYTREELFTYEHTRCIADDEP